jgi:hypothetical protein
MLLKLPEGSATDMFPSASKSGSLKLNVAPAEMGISGENEMVISVASPATIGSKEMDDE